MSDGNANNRPGPDGNSPKSDPFHDLESIRLSQDFAGSGDVRKLRTTVPVRKAMRQEFIRVHRDENYRLPVAILDLQDDQPYYVVPELQSELIGEYTAKMLYTAVNRQGVVFLWPVRLPDVDGRLDRWNESAAEAAEFAMDRWIRVVSNRSLGAYEIYEATGDLPDPVWPEEPLNELMRIAFRGRVIDSPAHSIIKRLSGLS